MMCSNVQDPPPHTGWTVSLKSLVLPLASAGSLPSPPLPTPPSGGDCCSMSNFIPLFVLGHNIIFFLQLSVHFVLSELVCAKELQLNILFANNVVCSIGVHGKLCALEQE